MNRTEYLYLIEPAIKLVATRGGEYNTDIELSDYFPFADKSYQQMLHVKLLRLRSLSAGGAAPTEKMDSLLDLINYAVFYLAHLEEVNDEHF